MLLSRFVLPNLKEKEAETHQTNLLGWRIWAVIVGAMSAAQQAINGRLGVLLENTAQAAFVSFFIGFLAIFIVSLFIDHRFAKNFRIKKSKTLEWNWWIFRSFICFCNSRCCSANWCRADNYDGLDWTNFRQYVGSTIWLVRSSKYGIQIWQIVGILIMLTGIIFIKFL